AACPESRGHPLRRRGGAWRAGALFALRPSGARLGGCLGAAGAAAGAARSLRRRASHAPRAVLRRGPGTASHLPLPGAPESTLPLRGARPRLGGGFGRQGPLSSAGTATRPPRSRGARARPVHRSGAFRSRISGGAEAHRATAPSTDRARRSGQGAAPRLPALAGVLLAARGHGGDSGLAAAAHSRSGDVY